MSAADYIGVPVARVDAWDKASGRQVFPSDFIIEGMLWVRVLRARYPHACITRLDTLAAESLPGVVRVVTARDVPGVNRFGISMQDQPVLCEDKVRYLGDAIALVAAESKETAEEGLALIEVEYEVLPAVTDPLGAMGPNSPLVHSGGNLLHEVHFSKGDVERGFAEADVIIENEYRTQMQEHAFIETEAGVGYYDENGVLAVRAGGQYPHRDRTQIARAMGLKNEEVRAITPVVGGGFGGKDEVTVQIYLALVTYLTKRPCKIMLERDESIVSGTKRHPFILRYKTGATRDGRFVVAKVEMIADTGAYASLGREVLNLAVEHATGPYNVAHTRIDGYLVYTNNGFSGAFRGFGVPQATVGIESQMDLMARAISMDSLEFRVRNALKKGDKSGINHTMKYSVGIGAVLEAVGNGSLYPQREELKASIGVERRWKKRGVGMAACWQGFGLGIGIPDYSHVRIELKRDGRLLLLLGGTDMGGGNATAFCQIAAHEVGVGISEVDYVIGDTGLVPDGGPCSASRNVYTMGNAVLRAARDLREKVIGEAEERLSCSSGELSISNAMLTRRGKEIFPLKELAPLTGEGVFHTPVADVEFFGGLPHAVFGFGAQVALVEVDTLTGEIDLLKVENVLDAGRVLNPQGLTGQSEGGVVMGMGYGLFEQVVLEDGYFKNPHLTTYILPGSLDIPQEIITVPVEVPEETGPYGAKGIGEIVMTPTAAAILNALDDAIGVRFRSLPVTPEMVVRALRSSG